MVRPRSLVYARSGGIGVILGPGFDSPRLHSRGSGFGVWGSGVHIPNPEPRAPNPEPLDGRSGAVNHPLLLERGLRRGETRDRHAER